MLITHTESRCVVLTGKLQFIPQIMRPAPDNLIIDPSITLTEFLMRIYELIDFYRNEWYKN